MPKRALLIGCNYPGTKAELKGCVNDVKAMQAMLTESFGFPPANIKVLIDVGEGEKPTGKAIKQNLATIVQACQPGDVLFFHFSGHGTQVTDKTSDETDKKDEAIVPTDLNIITDDDLRAIFGKLPANVRLTMVTDCCHSGSLIDHPEQQISGDKAQGSTVAADTDEATTIQTHFKGVNAAAESSNRALPQNDFVAMLSEKLGIDASAGVHQALQRGFGPDASAKSLKALGQLTDIADQLKTQPGIIGKAGGMLGGFLGQVKQQAEAVGIPMTATPAAAPAAAAPAAAPAAAAPAAAAPAAGTKVATKSAPAPGTGGEGDGALITGCQAHETSADACPGGDPTKAYGALTNALTTIVKQHKAKNPNAPISYKDLVVNVREMLNKAKFTQNPCLECADETIAKAFVC